VEIALESALSDLLHIGHDSKREGFIRFDHAARYKRKDRGRSPGRVVRAGWATGCVGGNLQGLFASGMRWLVRLEFADRRSDVHQRFKLWINEDPAHRLAFQFAEKNWGRWEALRSIKPLTGDVDPDLLISSACLPRPIADEALKLPSVPKAAMPFRINALRAAAAGLVILILMVCGAHRRPETLPISRSSTYMSGNRAVIPTYDEQRIEFFQNPQAGKLCGGANGMLLVCDDS